MERIRKPAVADRFYPEDKHELDELLGAFLGNDHKTAPYPKAIIAPHAGYIYSGPIAGTAYARLARGRNQIKRIILMGPCHQVPVQGLAASSATGFATPLGNIEVNQEAMEKILELPQVHVLDAAHHLEHSLEVHLPFLQKVLNHFTLVPLVVGDTTKEEVAEVLEYLWGGEETVIVVSSDLSHYHDYQTAKKLDQATSNAIEQLAPEKIHYDDACGRNPIQGLLHIAKKFGLKATTLDLRNSGDTAGTKDQVVGYGAYIFE